MNNMEKEITQLLKKIFPRLLKYPKLMLGHDTSQEELSHIIETMRLPLQNLENLGGDHFFFIHTENFEITEEEGSILDFYLEHRLKDDKKELLAQFPFLE